LLTAAPDAGGGTHENWIEAHRYLDMDLLKEREKNSSGNYSHSKRTGASDEQLFGSSSAAGFT